MLYSLDTNVFTERRKNYPARVFGSLWRRVEELIASGDAGATEYVRFELEKQDDEILEWTKSLRGLYVAIDEPIQHAVKDILSEHPRLLDDRKGRSGADPFVIALAQIHRATVVTEERLTGSLDNRPNIPDVCSALGVRCIPLVQLCAERGWSF